MFDTARKSLREALFAGPVISEKYAVRAYEPEVVDRLDNRHFAFPCSVIYRWAYKRECIVTVNDIDGFRPDDALYFTVSLKGKDSSERKEQFLKLRSIDLRVVSRVCDKIVIMVSQQLLLILENGMFASADLIKIVNQQNPLFI